MTLSLAAMTGMGTVGTDVEVDFQSKFRSCSVAWSLWGTYLSAVAGAPEQFVVPTQLLSVLARQAFDQSWSLAKSAPPVATDPVAETRADEGRCDEDEGDGSAYANAAVPFPRVVDALGKVTDAVKAAMLQREPPSGCNEGIAEKCQLFVDEVLRARDMYNDPEAEDEPDMLAPRVVPQKKRWLTTKTRVEEKQQPLDPPKPDDDEIPLRILGATSSFIPPRSRRRGRGLSKKRRFISLFYGNVNRYTDKAERFVHDAEFDVVLYGEHHLRGDMLGCATKELVKHKWHVTASEALPSKESEDGTNGGTFAAAKAHLSSSPFANDIPAGKGVARCKSIDVSGRVLHLMGGDIMVFSGYARNGDTQHIVDEVKKRTANGRIPFIIMADFNIPFETMKEQQWVSDLRAVAFAPTGGDISCHLGRGSLIDYAIVSLQLVGYVAELALVTDVPWGPHDGLRLMLERDPMAARVRMVPHKAKRLRPEGAFAGSSPLPWETAVSRASEFVEANPVGFPAEVQAAADKLGTSGVSTELAKRYRVWARANALQALAARKIEADSPEGKKLLMTALPYVPKWVQARAPNRQEDVQRIAGAAGTGRVRLWATVAALLSKLHTALKTDPEGRTAWRTRASLASYIGSRKPDAVKAWATARREDTTAARFAAHRAISGGLSEVENSIKCVQRIARTESQRFRAKNRAEWQAFVRASVEARSGILHRITNAPNKPAAEVTADGVHDTFGILKVHTGKWGLIWKSNEDSLCEDSWKAVNELRKRAMKNRSEVLARINIDNLNEVLKKFKPNTGVGADHVFIQDMICSTEEAKLAWLALARTIISSISWPLQALTVLMRLIGKKSGGTRTIATCASVYRVLMALTAEPVRKWDVEVALRGDTAKRGTNPTLEVFDRHANLEIIAHDKKPVVATFWDGEKFFDQLGVSSTIDSCEKKNFPKVQLSLGMQVHRAPRILLDGNEAGPTVAQTGCSVLPGCTLSPSLARARVQDSVQPGSEGEEFMHVDDVAQFFHDASTEKLVSKAISEGVKLGRSMRANDVVISPKTVVVSSRPGVAARVAAGIAKALEVDIKSASSNNDLGVETGGGTRRVAKAQKERVGKARVRCKRIRFMVKASLKASKLTRVGAIPMATYGMEAQGAAPSMVKRLRSALVASVQAVGGRACTTSSLWWRLGAKYDPAVFTCTKQLNVFIKLFKKAGGKKRRKMMNMWEDVAPVLASSPRRWAMVSGPIRAAIATMLDQDWDVFDFRRWVSPRGKAFVLKSILRNAGPVLDEIAQCAGDAAWRSAASHCCGEGLEQGSPGLEPARSAKAKFIKEGRFDEAKAVDLLVCGGLFTSHTQGHCACGAVDGPKHRYWLCPLIKDIPDHEIAKHDSWLHEVFFKPMSRYNKECWWGRGLLPAGWVPKIEELNTPPTETSNAKKCFGEAADIFLDGSGGRKSVAKCCGSAAVALKTSRDDEVDDKFKVNEVALIGSEVPGKQTVPRSELHAARLGMKYVRGTDVRFRPDATYTHNNFNKFEDMKDTLTSGTNGDLWEEFAREVSAAGARISSSRIPSHTSLRDLVVAPVIPLRAFLGNHLADVTADAAAEAAIERQPTVMSEIERAEAIAFHTMRRLAIVEAARWKRGEVKVPEPALAYCPAVSPADMEMDTTTRLSAAGHNLIRRGKKIFCTLCRRSTAKALNSWYSPCRARPAADKTQVASPCCPRRPAPQAVAAVRSTGFVDTDVMISMAKRRRIMADLRTEVRAKVGKVTQIQARIDNRVKHGICTERYDSLPNAPLPPPFLIHHSHVCVVTGGYAGCVRCGSVCGWNRTKKMEDLCTKTVDTAKLAAVRRLMRALPPVKAQSWPTGETGTPTVFKWRPAAPPRQCTERHAEDVDPAVEYPMDAGADSSASSPATPAPTAGRDQSSEASGSGGTLTGRDLRVQPDPRPAKRLRRAFRYPK